MYRKNYIIQSILASVEKDVAIIFNHKIHSVSISKQEWKILISNIFVPDKKDTLIGVSNCRYKLTEAGLQFFFSILKNQNLISEDHCLTHAFVSSELALIIYQKPFLIEKMLKRLDSLESRKILLIYVCEKVELLSLFETEKVNNNYKF